MIETQCESLANQGIRVELDDHYECLPKQKFATRPLETVEGKKQLNFVFEYRTKGSAHYVFSILCVYIDVVSHRHIRGLLFERFRSR